MQKCGRCAGLNKRQVSEELLEHQPAVGLEQKNRTTTSLHPFLRKNERVKKPDPLVTHKNLFHMNKESRQKPEGKEQHWSTSYTFRVVPDNDAKVNLCHDKVFVFYLFCFEMLFFQMQKWQNMIAYECFYSKRLSMRNTLHSESPAVVEIWGMLPRTHIVMVPLKSTKVLQFCFQVLLVSHPLPLPHPSPAHQ